MSNQSEDKSFWKKALLAIVEKTIRKLDIKFTKWDAGSGVSKPIDPEKFSEGKGALLANEEYVTAEIFTEFYSSILRHGAMVDIGNGKKEFRYWDMFREVRIKVPKEQHSKEVDLLIVRCKPLDTNNYYRFPALIECKQYKKFVAAETTDDRQKSKGKRNDVSSDIEKLLKYRDPESLKSIFFNKESLDNVTDFYLCQLIWGECKDKADFEKQEKKVLEIIGKKMSTELNTKYSANFIVNKLIFPKDNKDRSSFEMKSWNWILLIEIAPFKENWESEKQEYWFQYNPSQYGVPDSSTQT